MRKLSQLFIDTKWTVMLTVLVIVLFGHLITRGAISFYNKHMPVVEMTGKLVHTDGNSTLIHIVGEKQRDCKFVRIYAMYVFRGNGMLNDAFIERVSGPPPDGSTKPVGSYDLGFWRVWPTDDATKVLVFVQHECGSETVLSKIAEVPLEPAR